MAHYCLGLIFLFSRRAEPAIAELEQALAFDPNHVFAHAQIGLAKAVLGRAEETERHVMEELGREEEALAWGRRSIEANRTNPMARFHYAAALALCGRTEEAGLEPKEGLRLMPDFTVRRYADDELSDNPTYLKQRAHSRRDAACGRAGRVKLFSEAPAPWLAVETEFAAPRRAQPDDSSSSNAGGLADSSGASLSTGSFTSDGVSFSTSTGSSLMSFAGSSRLSS